MATKKAGGTASNLKDSNAQRLGVKLFAGQQCRAGNIIVRQRGTCFTTGENTMFGSDDTIFATTDGVVDFQKKQKMNFDGRRKIVNVVHVKSAKN